MNIPQRQLPEEMGDMEYYTSTEKHILHGIAEPNVVAYPIQGSPRSLADRRQKTRLQYLYSANLLQVSAMRPVFLLSPSMSTSPIPVPTEMSFRATNIHGLDLSHPPPRSFDVSRMLSVETLAPRSKTRKGALG